VKVKKVKSIELSPISPFNFDATFHKPDHFTSGDNLWRPKTRWQTFYWQGKQLGLKFQGSGNLQKPKIKLNIYYQLPLDSNFIDSLVEEISYRFNLNLDLNDFYQSFKDDKVLGPIIKKWKGLRPGHPSSLYEYLIIGIVLQNATVRRSIQMFQALLENYGKLIEYDNKKLWCFWKPGGLEKVTEDELRALKVGYRAKSIKKIDDDFTNNKISELELRSKDLETQREELLEFYGVGPATVSYLLFDVFHHYDFFDHISPWEQKIYSKLFFNQEPEDPVPVKKLLKYFEKFKGYRQLAVYYIWEDLWWKRKTKKIPWLEKLIRI